MNRRGFIGAAIGAALAGTGALLYKCGLITEEERGLFKLDEPLPETTDLSQSIERLRDGLCPKCLAAETFIPTPTKYTWECLNCGFTIHTGAIYSSAISRSNSKGNVTAPIGTSFLGDVARRNG